MKSKARDELIRALATISGVELRRLIPWEKRRRRRVFLSWAMVALILALGVSLWPIENSRKLDHPKNIDTDQTIEYCDVAGDRLVLAARQRIKKQNQETVNDVEYTMLYDDALNGKKGDYLDKTGYSAPSRLIKASRLRSAQKILDGTDRAVLSTQARKMAEEKYPYVQDDKKAFLGVWAAEPRPDLKVLLYGIKPSPFDKGDGPAAGNSVVVIGKKGRLLRFMIVEGLYPPEIDEKSISTRGAAMMDGLPIVASGNDLFIGMSIRKDGGLGGLWRWNGTDTTWELQKEIPRGVFSMIADPQKPGRILLSTAPGQWESDARKGQMATRFFERRDAQSGWREIQLMPIDSKAEVQLCGFARTEHCIYVISKRCLRSARNGSTSAGSRRRTGQRRNWPRL